MNFQKKNLILCFIRFLTSYVLYSSKRMTYFARIFLTDFSAIFGHFLAKSPPNPSNSWLSLLTQTTCIFFVFIRSKVRNINLSLFCVPWTTLPKSPKQTSTLYLPCQHPVRSRVLLESRLLLTPYGGRDQIIV